MGYFVSMMGGARVYWPVVWGYFAFQVDRLKKLESPLLRLLAPYHNCSSSIRIWFASGTVYIHVRGCHLSESCQEPRNQALTETSKAHWFWVYGELQSRSAIRAGMEAPCE